MHSKVQELSRGKDHVSTRLARKPRGGVFELGHTELRCTRCHIHVHVAEFWEAHSAKKSMADSANSVDALTNQRPS